jgi:heterogeneous nuclear ribonucleoprotein A1/A3
MSFKRNAQDQYKKLFVGGLNINTTTEGLRKYYEQFGAVSDAIVMRDPSTQRSRCFGFVTFDSVESVDAAQAARPHIIDEKQVDSKRAIPKEDTAPESRVACNKIFVGGIRRDITEDQLRDYFSQYGGVTECILAKDKATGVSRGFGFITFDDTDAVDKVIVARPHTINDSKADVKKAIPKEEMATMKPREHTGGGQYGNASYGGGYNSGGWQGGYGQPASQQGWGNQGYGAQPYSAYGGMEANGGWGAPVQQQMGGYSQPAQGGWTDPSAQGGASQAGGAGGFGSYSQQPAYGGGGPMRAGGYGAQPTTPYGRR